MKKLFSVLLILALCLTAFAACVGKTEPTPAPTAVPAVEPTIEPTAEPAIEPAAPVEADATVAYAIVFDTYTQLLTEGWGGEELAARDLPLLIRDCVGDAPFDNMGYLFLDVDGDGTQELLIGTTVDDPFYAPIVFEMYAQDPEGIIRVFTSGERARYYLCNDNTFLFEGTNSASDSASCSYSYANGTLTEIADTGALLQKLSYTPFSQLSR